MAYPEPANVSPWYLRNITQALALNEATGNVYVRTDAQFNVANANITVGNVSVTSLGNVDVSGTELPVTVESGNVTVFQGTDPWVVSGNVNVDAITGNIAGITANVTVVDGGGSLTVDGNVGITGGNITATISGTANVDIINSYEMSVAQGLVPNTSSLFKAGYNPSIANNNEESLWTYSELYPWDSWATGNVLSVVSTDSADTGYVDITGLRSSDWAQITETVTMTGTTPVVTSNSFIRLNNLHYTGGAPNAGDITASVNGDVVGYIETEFGQAQMAQYTVPAGYTAYLQQGQANMGKGNDGTGKFKYRLYGSSFQTAMVFLLYQSTFNYKFGIPLVLPEKTDLDVTMVASVSGTACSCAYDIILIAN